jgi:hypothetical protein
MVDMYLQIECTLVQCNKHVPYSSPICHTIWESEFKFLDGLRGKKSIPEHLEDAAGVLHA